MAEQIIRITYAGRGDLVRLISTADKDSQQSMKSTALERINKSNITRPIAVTLAAGVFLAIIAPLGSDNLSISARFIYWIGLCIAGSLGGILGEVLWEKYCSGSGTIARILLMSLIASVFVSIALFTFFSYLNIHFGFVTFFYVFIISLAITGITEGFRNKPTISASENDQQPALIERLPIELREADIYAISAEDHYVKVHTSAGHTMILMRFKDAVRDISPLPGMISHRSWWVAEQGVKSIKKQSRSAVLTLKNDELALVSRAGLKELRELGWVD